MRVLRLYAVPILLGLAGCVSVGGGNADVEVNDSSISKGKELTDLQRALQEGALSQGEYDRLHAVILRRAN